MRIAFILTLSFANIILAAHVMLYMWGLFAVPLGAPVISAPQALGVLLILQAPTLSAGISTITMLNRLTPEAKHTEVLLESTLTQTVGWLMGASIAFIAARCV